MAPDAHTARTPRLLALALAGGCSDAAVYLGLGHVFPANMTGNTVVLVVAVAERSGAHLLRAAVALGGYCAGVAVGRVLLSSGTVWPDRARVVFAAEATLIAALLLAWLALGGRPRGPLIGAAALTMGLQSVAVNAAHVGGVSTTYMTGTLTAAVSRLVDRLRGAPADRAPALPGASWLVYAGGALLGALLEREAHAVALAVPLLAVAAGGLVGSPRSRHAAERPVDTHPASEQL